MINSVEWPVVGSMKAIAMLFTSLYADRETRFNLRGTNMCIDMCLQLGPKPPLVGTGAKH